MGMEPVAILVDCLMIRLRVRNRRGFAALDLAPLTGVRTICWLLQGLNRINMTRYHLIPMNLRDTSQYWNWFEQMPIFLPVCLRLGINNPSGDLGHWG